MAADPQLGRLIPRYAEKGALIEKRDLHFGKILGHGASGVTHRAVYNGEPVAVKIYSTSVLCQDFESVRNEMDIMTAMKHENIISFCGLCITAEPPWAALVTALAPGGELGDALYKERSLRRRGDRARFHVALGIAAGLKYLHANDVIHRDIKPANILLDADFTAKLTDFGYSRFIDHNGDMTGETGSYRYMAPEVTRHGKYDAKADVFSFAIVVNEIFTGHKPYEFNLPLDVALGVVKRNLRPNQSKIKNARLRNILVRAWDGNPELRPDWDEIIKELTGAQAEMAAEKERRSMGKLFRRKAAASSAGDSKE